MDHGDTTTRLRALAPTLAELPRWTRRLQPAAAWTGITVLFLGAAALFWRTVTLSTDVALVHKDIAELNAGLADLKAMRESQQALDRDVAVVKDEVGGMKAWRERLEGVAEQDWQRRQEKKRDRRRK